MLVGRSFQTDPLPDLGARRHPEEAVGPGGHALPNPTGSWRHPFRENAHSHGPFTMKAPKKNRSHFLTS